MSNQIQNQKKKPGPNRFGIRTFGIDLTFGFWHLNLQKEGFTLLELVVAITLITAALLGPLAVISNSFPRLQFSKQKLTALHLAQEGI